MKIDDLKKLQQKKYRNKLKHFLVEGEHLILELEKALSHRPELSSSRLYVTDDYQDWDSPLKKQLITSKQMSQISDTKSPQGIVAAVPLWNQASAPLDNDQKTAIYLYEVQDPGNLGTIIRTLGWFGGFKLLLSPNSVDPFNPKVVRSSMGALFHLDIELDVTLDSLPKRFSQLATLDMAGSPITDTHFYQSDCLIFGNEARGVPREWLTDTPHQAFTIAGSGQIESLNLAQAVNICSYELQR